MKQPFEDLPVRQRTFAAARANHDDLLSLEDVAIPRRAMMIALARHLRRATLVGNPAPIVHRMYERLSEPRPGDLVVERSAEFGRNEDNQVKGFGILIERRVEWAATDEEWRLALLAENLETSEPRPTDEAWYVLYGPQPEDVCRWTNCSFTTVPVDPRMFDD